MNSFPISGTFTISRGSKTTAEVVTCSISEDGHTGHGECVPYGRYGESIESVVAEIEANRQKIEAGMTRPDLITTMKPGAAVRRTLAPVAARLHRSRPTHHAPAP